MTSSINTLLALIKWPIALIALAALPALFLSIIELATIVAETPNPIILFGGGAALYWFLDKLIFHRQSVGSWFSTLEHEITHAIFAWATLHRVAGMHVTSHKGGHVMIIGGGNWLIYIAPYWFPTLCIPIMLYAAYFSNPHPAWAAALGFTFMFHHISTWRETHDGQTDLQETGFLFAWLFLPTANLLAAGAVVSFAFGHTGFMLQFFDGVYDSLQTHLSIAFQYLAGKI